MDLIEINSENPKGSKYFVYVIKNSYQILQAQNSHILGLMLMIQHNQKMHMF